MQQIDYKLPAQTAINVHLNPAVSLQLTVKRMFDLVSSLILMIILAPFFIVVAIAIKLDSPGPVFFRQLRVGYNQRRFQCYKFRSMRAGNHDLEHEKFIDQLMTRNSSEKNEEAPIYKITNDNRVTRIGHLLRKSSLDELPQLWNVFKGDMSLVGPRPAIGYELRYHDKNMLRRFSVMPGITGYWQVNSRYSVDYKEMVSMDLYYVDHWSIWLDFKIVLSTVPVLLKIDKSF